MRPVIRPPSEGERDTIFQRVVGGKEEEDAEIDRVTREEEKGEAETPGAGDEAATTSDDDAAASSTYGIAMMLSLVNGAKFLSRKYGNTYFDNAEAGEGSFGKPVIASTGKELDTGTSSTRVSSFKGWKYV